MECGGVHMISLAAGEEGHETMGNWQLREIMDEPRVASNRKPTSTIGDSLEPGGDVYLSVMIH